MARRTSTAWLVMEKPATRASPEEGAKSVVSILIVVVLPAPLEPSKPKTSPALTERVRASTAVNTPKRRVRALISRTISPIENRRGLPCSKCPLVALTGLPMRLPDVSSGSIDGARTFEQRRPYVLLMSHQFCCFRFRLGLVYCPVRVIRRRVDRIELQHRHFRRIHYVVVRPCRNHDRISVAHLALLLLVENELALPPLDAEKLVDLRMRSEEHTSELQDALPICTSLPEPRPHLRRALGAPPSRRKRTCPPPARCGKTGRPSDVLHRQSLPPAAGTSPRVGSPGTALDP